MGRQISALLFFVHRMTLSLSTVIGNSYLPTKLKKKKCAFSPPFVQYLLPLNFYNLINWH